MAEKLLALVATLTANPGAATVGLVGLLAVCYVVAFLGWCAWHFVQDIVDERGEHQARSSDPIDLQAYRKTRPGRGKDVA
jgi:hypothetical protein